MRRGDTLLVSATRLDAEGFGLARAGDVEVHARELLPGESARVRVEHIGPRRDHAWATIAERTSPPAPTRVAPACPAFGRCGGCAWQHLSYGAQLKEKRRQVQEALAGILPPGVEVAPVRAAPSPLGYRNKAKYVVATVGTRGKARVVLGAYAPRSHDVVDTIGCRIVEGAIDDVARGLRGAVQGSARVLAPFDPKSKTGHLRYAVLRSGANGEVVVTLVVRSRAPRGALEDLAHRVMRLRGVSGVMLATNDTEGDVILPSGATLLAGKATVCERLGGALAETDAVGFFQVNRSQAEAMYTYIADVCGADGALAALELYCGAGGFSLAMAAHGATTLGLDVDARSVAVARDAAARAGLTDRAAFAAVDLTVRDDIERAIAPALERGRFGAIVANPPRKGLSPAVRDLLVLHSPPRAAYVSCSPQSLARDLADLCARGFRVTAVTPFDLMPGTAQVETIVVLAHA